MKFKNYRNSYTNEDTIYSRKNIADMSVREAFSRKDEIMAQHNSIGIPSEGELQSSPNAVWVDSYTRDDGTEVRGYWRSKPEGGRTPKTSNSQIKNEEMNKDEQGTVTGGASEIKDKVGGIEIKDNYKTNVIQDGLIDYNNEQNEKYPDARDCMNIAIIGPENIKDNENYKILSDENVRYIKSKSGIKLSDDIKTVEFSENSSMANSLNNSQELKQQIKNNINKIENSENIQVSFNKDENLFRSLHNATVFDCKIEKGIVTGYIYDKYDFDYQSYNQNSKMNINIANNIATAMQHTNIIKDYNIIVPIQIKL